MDLQSMTPAQIDALWFPLMVDEAVAKARIEQYSAKGKAVSGVVARWLAEAEASLTTAQAAQVPFDAEWDRRGGWVRAYIAITNGRGHVHATAHCGSLHHGRQRTALDLLPQVSGLTTAEVIDLAGERACTRCYPGAPVGVKGTHLFAQSEIEAQQAREAKAAAKTEKDAKKAAAAITNPDGTPLIGYGGEWDVIKTERTAWITAVDITFNHRAYGYDPHAAVFFQIITALAAKTGRTFESVHEEIEAKAQAKAKREHVTI